MTGQMRGLNPRQTQKPAVVGQMRQRALPLPARPADELIAGGRFPGGGAKEQASYILAVTVPHQIMNLPQRLRITQNVIPATHESAPVPQHQLHVHEYATVRSSSNHDRNETRAPALFITLNRYRRGTERPGRPALPTGKNHKVRVAENLWNQTKALDGKGSGRRRGLHEQQLVFLDRHLDWLALVQVAFEDFFRQGIFQEPFHRAAHRTSAVSGIVALFHQKVLRLFVQLQQKISALEPLHDFGDLQAEDFDQVRLGERAEDDDVIQAIKEFRAENAAGFVPDLFAHSLLARFLSGRAKTPRRLFF